MRIRKFNENMDEEGKLIKIYKSAYELRKSLKIDWRSIEKNNFKYKGYFWKVVK